MIPTGAYKVLDHGLVQLVEFMGDDLAIVQAAQSSFGRISQEYGEREQRILRSLMRERHGVPFEHVSLKFRIKMPIAVARQLVKHRISSWSEHSARYAQIEMEYYVPELAWVRTQEGKPMEYKFSTANREVAVEFLERLEGFSAAALDHYEWAVEAGIAKEQARLFVPVNFYTTITWTINGRSLLNVLSLRNDSHAQGETRAFAEAMENLAKTVIPDTIEAFDEFGRRVP